jgi:hypothetical protein
MNRENKHTHWLETLEQEKTKQLKKAEKTSIEQKLVKAKKLLSEAALQFEEIGLCMTFEIKIKSYPLGLGASLATDPGENPPPSK